MGVGVQIFSFYESRKEGHMLIFFLSFEKMLEVVERLKKLYDMTGQTKKLYEVSHPTELTFVWYIFATLLVDNTVLFILMK